VRSFTDDLLNPLLAELNLSSVFDILPGYNERLAPGRLSGIQQFLACIRNALVGSHGPKTFQDAAHLWHRRAEAVAALRNENQSDRLGWPPLCPPWTSPCGHYQIVPLTTAKDLVSDGNFLHHCVGTYYDLCRTGATQILSLRKDGQPAVTAEIALDRQISSLRIASSSNVFSTRCPTISICIRRCGIFCATSAAASTRSITISSVHTVNGPMSTTITDTAAGPCRSTMHAKLFRSISRCYHAAHRMISISGATKPAFARG
jgi:hypothetical protein